MADGLKAITPPLVCKRQQKSTSSPALRYSVSNPPTLMNAQRWNAMLQPGMCSATTSVSSTWVGLPGAAATAACTQFTAGGEMFGPPTPQ